MPGGSGWQTRTRWGGGLQNRRRDHIFVKSQFSGEKYSSPKRGPKGAWSKKNLPRPHSNGLILLMGNPSPREEKSLS